MYKVTSILTENKSNKQVNCGILIVKTDSRSEAIKKAKEYAADEGWGISSRYRHHFRARKIKGDIFDTNNSY